MELDDILKEIGEAAATMGVKFDPTAASNPQVSAKAEAKVITGEQLSYERLEAQYKAVEAYKSQLVEENKTLREENDKLRKAAQKLLEDFDKVNTMLRDEKAKNANVEELDKQRKTLYNEATDLRRQRTAYAKALGTIHGALETLASELK